MFYLVYVSSAVALLDTPDLISLLNISRKNNLAHGITGMLLYKGGNFMQILEGEEKKVLELFQKISLDNRHKGIIMMLSGNCEQRQFPNWSMAFHNLNEPHVASILGYNAFLNTPLNDDNLINNSQQLWQLLHIFKANIR